MKHMKISCCENCTLFVSAEYIWCNHPSGPELECIDSYDLKQGVHPDCPLLDEPLELSTTPDVREISIEEEEEKEDSQGLFDRALKDWEDNKE